MYDVGEKRSEDDQFVIIEDDIWVGTNVTILKGVTVGQGSIICSRRCGNKKCVPIFNLWWGAS